MKALIEIAKDDSLLAKNFGQNFEFETNFGKQTQTLRTRLHGEFQPDF